MTKMPLGLQKRMLIERFVGWNPGVDAHEVDWRSMDQNLSYEENLRDLHREYPQYNWGHKKVSKEDATYKMFKQEAHSRGYVLQRAGAVKRREAKEAIRKRGPKYSVKVRLHWRTKPDKPRPKPRKRKSKKYGWMPTFKVPSPPVPLRFLEKKKRKSKK